MRRATGGAAAAAALALALAALLGDAGARPIWVINCGAITDKDNKVVNPERTVQETINLDDFAPAGPVTNTIPEKQGRFSKWRRGLTRADSLIYRIRNVPNARQHQMRLEWAEVTHCSAGARVFDIYVNGNRLYANFDPFVKAGSRCKNAVLRIAKFPVTNNEIVVELRPTAASRQPPMLNYLRIYGLDKFEQPSPSPILRPSPSPSPRPSPRPSPSPSPRPSPSPSPRPRVPAQCADLGVIQRKSVTDMSNTEWNNYVTAVARMRQRASSGRIGSTTLNVWERFAQIHLADALHRQSLFLPWHREMLWQMDIELNAGVRGVTQPYFDWSGTSNGVFRNSIFSSVRYGGSGASIPNGAFAGLVSRVPTGGARPVARSFDTGIFLPGSTTMNNLRTVSDFNSFRTTLETLHGGFHVAVGGDMIGFESPNDPLFYAHHAYIDKVWRDWELASSARSFSGQSTATPMMPWGTPASTSIARGVCVTYEQRRAANSAPPPNKSADPAGYQAAVDEAAKEQKDSADAARAFGAREEDIAKTAEVVAAVLAAAGIVLSDAN